MKLLVTGAAGFIGSHFVDFTLQAHPEDQVIGLDKLTYAGSLDNLAQHRGDGRFRFVQGDICDRKLLASLLEDAQVDCIVNFAAESHVDRSLDSPDLFLESNVQGVCALLDMVNRFRVPRFHQVSTDEVYGQLPLDPSAPPFQEDSPLRPSNPYAASKAAADLLALSYFRCFATPVTITRSANNYGPRQVPEKLIPRMIRLADAGQPLPLYGDGKNVRDWLYVRDHCAAVDLVVRKGRLGEVYNVGGGCQRSNLELVRLLLERMGKDPSLICFTTDRPGHDRRYALCWDKLRRQLGWQPTVDFDTGIRDTLHWYRSHPGFGQLPSPADP
ncbi:MAG TPA: dTDP-glucose 4,6-dehydratase [Firmicutes bacterium]|nr:dTDP-glucose 4,6-dehydratase [Bacillota bacterium]